ncbi:hypothetical protein EUX98_g4915 [Antrodiella citrinella]|uniref:Protein kinase domain-containing protein n=1 Tax=Antrodiella citrinella TaxID=2447956 RepID=A0A4S4MST4_9APHY|nr:hypothetical protein EUX98_g4915 [Antrodiella citrinella]
MATNRAPIDFDKYIDPTLSPEIRRGLREVVPHDPEVLWPHEIFWRDHQEWLAQKGYLLRPRYKPDWVPSWKGTGHHYDDYEDGKATMRGAVLDATRLSDGEMVMLKQIKHDVHPFEVDISQMFSEEPLKSHSRNHCIPIFEVLVVPDEHRTSILVMPLLRPYDDPRFKTTGEALEYFRQIFEGLQFMHQCHVAHRDCMYLNIMMDPRPLYPNMFHPAYTTKACDDWKVSAKHYDRTLKPVKYYLIDFGLSRKYDANDPAPREYPILGGDKTVPEFKISDGPFDPFPTDIYYLGSMIRQDFLQKLRGFEFMEPLVNDMVQADPTKRPTIDEVVVRFKALYDTLPWWVLRSRIAREGGESFALRAFSSVGHFVHTTTHILIRRKAMPQPPKYPQHTFST